MDNPEEGERYSRRALLRKGLVAGGSMALFGLTLARVGPAAAAPGSGSASASLSIPPQWPWGAPVNPAMPGYLSPGAEGGGGSTGINAPLLILPLLVSVDLGHPPTFPPFNVHVTATGDALEADIVQFDVPFRRDGGLALGRTQTEQWLGVFPIALGSGSFTLLATIQVPAAAAAPTSLLKSAVSAPASSSYTLSGDFSQVPSATTLPTSDQQTMVDVVGSQSQVFDVGTLFKLISDAAASANTKLHEINTKPSSISIGDMFEMQMLTNHLSQLDELSTSVVSSLNDAITSMARNVKG